MPACKYMQNIGKESTCQLVKDVTQKISAKNGPVLFFKKWTEKWTEPVHFFKKWTGLKISPGTNLVYAISLVSRLIFNFETKNYRDYF